MSDPLNAQSVPTALSAGHHELLGLFAEVNALAIQLKKATPLQPDGERAGAGRSILQVLSLRGPLTVPRIARLRVTSRQNTQILVNRLVREGYLELQSNPDHKRSALVQLTAAGTAWLETSIEQEAKSVVELRTHLTPAEVRSTTELLGRLRQWLAGAGWHAASAAKERKPAKLLSRNPETSRSPIPPNPPVPNPIPAVPGMLPENPLPESELPVSLL